MVACPRPVSSESSRSGCCLMVGVVLMQRDGRDLRAKDLARVLDRFVRDILGANF